MSKDPRVQAVIDQTMSCFQGTDEGRRAFGRRYDPPVYFEHGETYEVARYEPDEDGACEGRLVVVSEARHPATFFKIVVTEADGTAWELGTGSGCQQLAAQTAEAIWAGMLGLNR